MPGIGAAWRGVRDRFRASGIDTPDLDARLLAQHALGVDAIALSLREREAVSEMGLGALEALAARRLAGEPVARILGEKEFFGLTFALSPDTLIPRPETELLVELALKHLSGVAAPRVLDLGTGTGAIVVAVLANLPRASAVATDLSAGALATARSNAERHGVMERLDLRAGSWLEPVRFDERFDLIVSNPPYIPTADLAGLATEVRVHDPRLALDGGANGRDAYLAIGQHTAAHLCDRGALMVEIGFDQGKTVPKLLESFGFSRISVEKDLAGLDRVVLAHHP